MHDLLRNSPSQSLKHAKKVIIEKVAALLSIMANTFERNQFRNTGVSVRFERNCPTVTLERQT